MISAVEAEEVGKAGGRSVLPGQSVGQTMHV